MHLFDIIVTIIFSVTMLAIAFTFMNARFSIKSQNLVHKNYNTYKNVKLLRETVKKLDICKKISDDIDYEVLKQINATEEINSELEHIIAMRDIDKIAHPFRIDIIADKSYIKQLDSVKVKLDESIDETKTLSSRILNLMKN